VGKGTTVERLKIIQRSVNFKAGNLLLGSEIPPLGPEFPPLNKISGGQKFLPFKIRLSPLQNVVVQRSVKGPKILVWQNFHNFWPSKIWLSRLQQAVVQLAGRGQKF
jgi:hypothetical protein